ncbi:MAG: hypothetical protein GY799_21425 [Desulfobulbaceae bacterium]|nr:hypothetical protein [Desulfobulbaceae bacterium]
MSAKTNKTGLSVAKESSYASLPATPDWIGLEWNDLSDEGAKVTQKARQPVNASLMEQEGAVSDLDSGVEFQTDLTLSAYRDFNQAIFSAANKAQAAFDPTAVTSSGYTVASGGALAENTLVYARDYQSSTNNGLKVVGSGSTATNIAVTGLVADSSPAIAAKVDVAGVQGATGDIELDSSGNLTSTTLDFTTLGLFAGQSIYIGGSETATKFATAGYTGLARIRAISTNLLTLDKRDWTVGAADTGTGKTIQIFIGSFIRNVPWTHADFVDESFTFEVEFAGMTSGTDYEYPNGNKLNTASFELPLSDNAGLTYSFIGMDTPESTETQATGNRLYPYQKGALGTTSDFARLVIKNGEDMTDFSTVFKSLSFEVNRNVSAEKGLANLGAVDMNIGLMQVTGSGSVIFNDPNIVKAARKNTTITLDFCLNNSDGALHFDIPSCKFGSTNKSFPVAESVLLDVEITTQEDTYFGYVLSCTDYPYLPI